MLLYIIIHYMCIYVYFTLYIIYFFLHIMQKQMHFLNNVIKFANTKAVRNLLKEQTHVCFLFFFFNPLGAENVIGAIEN